MNNGKHKTVSHVFIWVIAGILLLITPFVSGPLYNDSVLNSFAQQLYNCSLPDATVIVEKHKICGKLIGNGDGMDFLACILIKSDKTADELEAYFGTLKFKGAKSSSKTAEIETVAVTENKLQTKYLVNDEILFNEKLVFDKQKYYAVVIYDGGFWNFFDGRGA